MIDSPLRAPSGIRAAAALVLACAWCAPGISLFSQTHSFRKIAESGSGTTYVDPAPAINEEGAVAYIRESEVGLKGVYAKPRQGTEIRIADNTGPLQDFSGVRIDRSGRVCFRASRDAGGSGIYAGSGGSLEVIAETGPVYSALAEGPAMNQAGAIAFRATLANGRSALCLHAGGATSVIADSGGSFQTFTATPALSESGVIAFAALLDNGTSGIYSSDGQTLKTLAQTSPTHVAWTDPSISATGRILSLAFRDDGILEMVSFSGTAREVVAETGDIFSSFGRPLLNSSGEFIFTAYRNGVGSGLYAGPFPRPGTILQRREKLFSGRVYDVQISTQSFNEEGEVAFAYELDNGLTGIAVAAPIPRRPSLFLTGNSRVALKRSLLTLRGSAIAEGGLSAVIVSYRQLGKGKKETRRYASVTGQTWNFKFRPDAARTTLTIRAIDLEGQSSPPVEVEVFRR